MRKYGKKLLTFLICASMFMQSSTMTSLAATPTDAAPENVETMSGLEELEEIEISDEEAQQLLNAPKTQADSITVFSKDWSKYGSSYIYDHLTQGEKTFYDALREACDNYINSTENAEYTEFLQNGERKSSYVIPESISYDGLEYENASGIVFLFIYQNPQYYFLETKLLKNSVASKIWLVSYDIFADGEARQQATQDVFNRVDQWVSDINRQPTMYEREKRAHDIVCQNTYYKAGTYDQSAYSMIMEGKTVCAGYTKSFSILANAAGIDTIGVTGSNHGWNMCYLDGAWYNVDVTNDDGTTIRYSYFNRADESRQYSSGHTPYKQHTGRIPKATSDYVNSVRLGETSLTLETGEQNTLSVFTDPDDAVNPRFVWESSDERVATVSQTGVVTANNSGAATIKVTVNNKTAECTVAVKADAPTPTPEPTPTPDPEPAPTTDATVTTSGIYVASHTHDKIVAGLVATPSKSADLEYRWLACDTSAETQSWFVIQDWTKNNQWLNWNPKVSGEYVIVGQVRVVGNESSQAQSSVGIPHHQQIKGKCQMPYTGAGGGYLIGIESYDNPNQEYSYELLVLDCTLLAQGKDAWIWSTGRCGAPDTSFWAVWQPQYGYYWTLFRVYDKDGTMIDQECYPFVNAY